MKSNFIKKVWNDSVWSKVIANGIIALISLFVYLLKENNFLDKTFKLKYIILSILLVLFIIILKSIFFNSKKKFNEEAKEFDKNLYLKLKKEHLDNCYCFLVDFDFQNIIDINSIKIFREYSKTLSNVDFEFIDNEMNSILKNLNDKFNSIYRKINQNFFPINNPNIEAYSIPKEWRDSDLENYNKITNELNELADDFCFEYRNLNRIGKRKYFI